MGPGSTVLVTGAGPIGMLTAEYAIARGATTVIVSEPNAGRRSIAEALGVQATLDPTAVDVVEAVRELTGGLGVDAAVECSGSAASRHCRGDQVARHRGADRVARPPGADRRVPLSLHEITLVGTWCYPVTDWPRIIALLASGRMDGRAAVTSALGLDSTVDGFERLIDRQGSDVKILINPRA